MKYKHLFFDWDHTLWDFNTNSKDTLRELFLRHDLGQKLVVDFDKFYETYKVQNYALWNQLYRNEITKEELRSRRFSESFKVLGANPSHFPDAIESEYVDLCSRKTVLMHKTEEVLEVLNKNYKLHIITNGFSQTQRNKFAASSIMHFFDAKIIADDIKIIKPDRRIFDYALEQAGAIAEHSIYIGDSLIADVEGAKNAGWDQVFFNPDNESHQANPTFEVNSMEGLLSIF